MKAKEILNEERLNYCRNSREKMREEHFAAAEKKIGRAAVCELRELYNIYDEKGYIWRASLWQPEIGGFYFSASGRDAEGFLPDIESTVQTLRFTDSSGLNSARGKTYAEAVPEKMHSALSRFTKSLLDKEDGYFYHPQWGKGITVARRGRDLNWSLSLLDTFGETTDCPTARDRLSSVKKEDKTLLPDHLTSTEAFREYLNELLSFTDPKKKSYWAANLLQSQTPQIRAAGKEYIDLLFETVSERQREDNGLWEEGTNYASVNGLMKFALMFTSFERKLNHAAAAMNSCIDAALSDEKIVFCCQFYNPLITMGGLLQNMRKFGEKEEADRLQGVVIARAAEFIRKTKEKILTCKREDGGFSYNPVPSSKFSQKAPVGLGLDESDVNSSGICSTGCLSGLCESLGIPFIPIYSPEDGELFYELIENAEVYPKIYGKPDWFDDAIDPEKITETY